MRAFTFNQNYLARDQSNSKKYARRRWFFTGKFLRKSPLIFKMTGLAGQFWQMESALGFTHRMNLYNESCEVILIFDSFWCDYSNETSSAILSHGPLHLVCSTNFWVCGWNPMVWPFNWNLFKSTFSSYYV